MADAPHTNPRTPNKSLGMGAEAVEKVHAAQQDDAGQTPSPAATSQQNTAATGAAGGETAGSEPLVDRDSVHVSGYGGMLGAPRTSAQKRETPDPTGSANAVGGDPSPT